MALDRFPPRSTLDYDASFRSGVAPLRQGFVDAVLGSESAMEARARRSKSPDPRAGSARTDAPDPFTQRRLDITHPFLNDDMRDAHVVASIPFTGRTDASEATRENGEPAGCASDGGTAWYRYRSAFDEELIANTFGTRYALSIGVFEVGASGTPEPKGCDTDLAGDALVQFAARRDSTYLFQITARATGGRLVFNLEPGGSTDLVSVTRSGETAQGISSSPSISADGRWVAFRSNAEGMTADTPDRMCADAKGLTVSQETAARVHWVFACFQVYLRNVPSGRTRLVSVSTDGFTGNGQSAGESLSADGRFVAFVSTATNLAPTDTDDVIDVFVRDVVADTTEKVSFSLSARPSPIDRWDRSRLWGPSISADGRFVAFVSKDPSHVEGDNNDAADVFVWDRSARRMERVSVSSAEDEARTPPNDSHGDDTMVASISVDGRYVVFKSAASNLDSGDTNGFEDVFVRDRLNGTTEIVSVSSAGVVGNGPATGSPRISADGRYVVFGSAASDLVPHDQNNVRDVFVRDRLSRTTFRASVSSAGRETDQPAFDATISRNGRYVAFSSAATTLAPGSRSAAGGDSCKEAPLYASCPEDLYVHDIVTRTTTRVPVAPGFDLQASALGVSISAGGGSLAFWSGCLECMATTHVWVHDRRRRRP